MSDEELEDELETLNPVIAILNREKRTHDIMDEQMKRAKKEQEEA
jgi:hypothetical protein